MDLANTLIRSITRAFYQPEHVIIMDAVLMHSTVRDDDLAHLLGQQAKHTRKEAFKLREDGLLSIHQRDEIREGSTRPFKRDFYFVDTHRAIDVIKFRVKSITRAVEKKYGQTVEEKKDYRCPRCKSAYTQMEVLDSVDMELGGFLCKRCKHSLQFVEDDGGAGGVGHEVQSRLNAQIAVFEKMLREIDNTDIPENTFEDALSRALDVKRDASINPAMRTQPVLRTGLPPATVKGLQTGPEKIEVSVMDDEKQKEAAALEAERKTKFLEQNALPTWHTASTVGTGPGINGDAGGAQANGSLLKEESEEKKIDTQAAAEEEKAQVDQDELAKYFAAQEAEADDDDDDSESGSDEESEDGEEAEKDTPPAKRVRIEEPSGSSSTQKGNAVGGLDGAADSGDDSVESG